MPETPLRLKVEEFDGNARAFAECGCYATVGLIVVPCEGHRGDADWEKRFLVEAEKAVQQHGRERYRRLMMEQQKKADEPPED
jgi:hypothetical protein